MLGAKTEIRNAEELKSHLINNGLMDFNRRNKVEDGMIIFPITKSFEKERVIIFEVDLPTKNKKTSWIDELNKILSAEELKEVKTAQDVLGNIAVIEIPENLILKEKEIAEALLKTNKHVKTVLKKAGEHDGIFRTQKMQWLAGENTKESIYLENNAKIKINVEEVYFSPRLSTERKRIAGQVKPGEEVLVMFSGAAPYPCVLSKNTDAKRIIGIELNPVGHKYGIENLKLNKIHNVSLINGDVNSVLPKMYSEIIGLKSAILDEEMNVRLAQNPKVFEFHLFEDDLPKNKNKLEEWIIKLKEKGIEVIIHAPFRKPNGESFKFNKKNIEHELKITSIIGELCKQYDAKAIIHPTNTDSKENDDENILIQNLKKLRNYYDYFYFENENKGMFAETKQIIRIAKNAGIKNICIDLAHAYIYNDSNDKIEELIKEVQKQFNTYFHIVDNNKKTHSCKVGAGFVDFERIMPYVTKGIAEVRSEDEKKATEMIESYNKLIDIIPQFDRICMPLPKSAEDFLEAAFSVSKNGTIIHFYDFLHETEFDLCEEKVKNACEKSGIKYEIISFNKCGQYSPGKFRVCLDFKIIK